MILNSFECNITLLLSRNQEISSLDSLLSLLFLSFFLKNLSFLSFSFSSFFLSSFLSSFLSRITNSLSLPISHSLKTHLTSSLFPSQGKTRLSLSHFPINTHFPYSEIYLKNKLNTPKIREVMVNAACKLLVKRRAPQRRGAG